MGKGKIVKSIVALAIAGGVVAGSYSLFNKNTNKNDVLDQDSEMFLDSEFVTDTELGRS